MAILVLPAIQKEYPLTKVKRLHGDYVLASKPLFEWKNWFNGKFQEEFDTYLEDHIGFRPLLVRLTNQIDYSLYNLARAEGVVIGENGYLYEYDYIRAFTGGDFLGDANIDKRMRRVKFVQKHLKEEYDVDFVVVFEPGKASVYPDYIPHYYLKTDYDGNNYDSFVKKAKEHGVCFIDYNNYFQLLKDTVSYPLYARYGTHWTPYGMSFVADSLIRYMEKLRNIEMRTMHVDSVVIEQKAREEDYDIASAMNLLCRLPDYEKLAYPVFRFGPPAGKYLPMVLVVGDSYFWNIFNANIPYVLFKNQAFWYFGNWVYPETYRDTLQVPQLNLREEVEKQEFVFLMVTERFLHKFDWAFVDNLYRIYGIESKYDKLYNIKASIWIYTEWFDLVVEKAGSNGITLEEMLELESRYVYMMNDPDSYMTLRGQEHFEWAIRNDWEWFKQVQIKAEDKAIALDDFIKLEADYVFKNNHPVAYEKYHLILQNKQMILQDSLLLKKVREEADYYCLTLDEMLQIEAERRSEDEDNSGE
jgi:hypothetical protein